MLPRPVSIFDDEFDKIASKAANTDFYMSAPPGETYRQGQLLGIVVKSQHVHTGRNDPHVLAVRQLLKMADANAREPRMTPESASAAMSFLLVAMVSSALLISAASFACFAEASLTSLHLASSSAWSSFSAATLTS